MGKSALWITLCASMLAALRMDESEELITAAETAARPMTPTACGVRNL